MTSSGSVENSKREPRDEGGDFGRVREVREGLHN